MDNSVFLPEEISKARKVIPLSLTEKEKELFKMYSEYKGWPLTKTMRICTKAVILLEYKKAYTLSEALDKARKLDIDGRIK